MTDSEGIKERVSQAVVQAEAVDMMLFRGTDRGSWPDTTANQHRHKGRGMED